MVALRRISMAFSLTLLLFFCFANVSVLRASPEPEVRRIRVRRQGCQDGVYEHEGRFCCLCAAGQKVQEHCPSNATRGKCEYCEPGATYNTEPNSKESCELCTSCDHTNANLEVDAPCTTSRDTTCKCKEGHFCPSGTRTCKICQPCKTCDLYGVKEPCSATSDAVCNEKPEGLKGGQIAGILIGVLLLAGLAASIVFRKRIKKVLPCWSYSASIPAPVREPLLPVDMEPHLADVADIVGWNDMVAIATASEMSRAIENVKLSNPHNAELWTMELLSQWVEKKGRNASVELVEALERRSKLAKAQKVTEKLYNTF
uniref:Tumor necrosis factor receptor superfamily member 6 n=1 Tax=Fundulus heteroclitus TaxID=8078 RepID=A0A3Q2TYD0_FUNHE